MDGVLSWANSIRTAMANDPGREIVHLQIQRQGFDFLDAYLDSVLTDIKQEPVIQLLKTPSHHKRLRQSKHNPISSIHTALLNAQQDDDTLSIPLNEQEHVNELSIIAEDDEDQPKDMAVPLKSTPDNKPNTLNRKPSMSIPAPSPFRKSVGAALTSLPTPGLQAGKRTSWLTKAKQVKALESRRVLSLGDEARNSAPDPQGPPKRKSDMIAASPAKLTTDDRKVKAKLSSPLPEEQESTLDKLWKTVEKSKEKSLGKSLGGVAAAALAEARKEAERKIRERNGDEEQGNEDVEMQGEKDRRMSVSDLVPKETNVDTSISTTPPNSPPPEVVFKKEKEKPAPPPVFTRPAVFTAPTAAKEDVNPFLGFGTRDAFESSSSAAAAMSQTDPIQTQSKWLSDTQDSQQKVEELLEDDDSWAADEEDGRGAVGWTPFELGQPNGEGEGEDETWSTVYTKSTSTKGGERISRAPSGSDAIQRSSSLKPNSAPFDFGAPSDGGEDEDVGRDADKGMAMEIDTMHLPPRGTGEEEEDKDEGGEKDMELDDEPAFTPAPVPLFKSTMDLRGSELQDLVSSGQSTIKMVKPTPAPSMPNLRPFMPTTTTPQSHPLGFFGQAGRLMSSVLGTGKKIKDIEKENEREKERGKTPEVKSLARAAATAKKQQEEAEKKKASRLKEIEARRQAALVRKAEEEKAKRAEEERKAAKAKEEAERKKKEKEEVAEKRAAAKAAIPVPAPLKKPASKDQLRPWNPPSSGGKPPGLFLKSAMKKPSVASINEAAAAGPSIPRPPSAQATTKSIKGVKSSSSLKSMTSLKTTKAKETEKDKPLDLADIAPLRPRPNVGGPPSTIPTVASESIELPDIASEYSDSDDDSRPRTFSPPPWAQAANLEAALAAQALQNPDEIFGRIGELRMEEIFTGRGARVSRYRARTSSANWAGPDGLTEEEEKAYARRMGFR